MKLLLILFFIFNYMNINLAQKSMSVFDIIEPSPPENNQNTNIDKTNKNSNMITMPPGATDQLRFAQTNSPTPSNNNSAATESNIQAMLDKLKSKVTSPFLKDNFTIDHIANFFANFISGNQFMNNLEVKELAAVNKLDVNEILKVKNVAEIQNLSFHKLNSKALSIDDNEINFDPEAILKLKSSKIAFKVKDVFEVITFMKYIVKICGSKLEKCDFNTLIKNHNANQLMQIIGAFEKKQSKFLDKEKDKIVEEARKKIEKVVIKENNNNLRKNDKIVINKVDNTINPNFKQTDKVLPTPTSNNLNNNSNIDEIEKELNNQIRFAESNNMLDDNYNKFSQDPNLEAFMNSYYYSLPEMNNEMTNI